MFDKKYTSTQFLGGALILAVGFAVFTVINFLIYRWVGYGLVTGLCLTVALYYAWRSWTFRDPVKRGRYLGNLNRTLWKMSWMQRASTLLLLANGAAIFSLLLLGWWIAALTAVYISYVVKKDMDDSQYIHEWNPSRD